MKFKFSKLTFLGLMLAFVLAVSFALTPDVSAAPNSFSVIGIYVPGNAENRFTPLSGTAITLPSSNYYLAPRAPSSGGGGKLPVDSVRFILEKSSASNYLAIPNNKFVAYNGHVTSGSNLVTQAYNNYAEVSINVDLTRVSSYTTSNGIRTYKLTVGETQFGKLVNVTLKIEAP